MSRTSNICKSSSKYLPAFGFTAVVFAIVINTALSAQDKNTVKVPGGSAFSEFKGYEDWQVVSVSKSDTLVAVIVANPAMIDAYPAGIPGNGKPFPDGAKMAKIHWTRSRADDSRADDGGGHAARRRLHGEG